MFSFQRLLVSGALSQLCCAEAVLRAKPIVDLLEILIYIQIELIKSSGPDYLWYKKQSDGTDLGPPQ